MPDLISRQAATDALRKMQTYKLFSGDDMLLIDQAGAQTELMLLPSAQPELKRGKWIYTGIEQNSFYCDKCLYLVKNMSYKFCPNCGAKMEVTT